MAVWLSKIDFTPADALQASHMNALGLDIRNWGGDVNGGGYRLLNVILEGSGGFQYTPSPLEITPGADSQSIVQLDQTVATVHTKRWTVGKNSTAESGANAGSDFGISRYSDAGALLSTPILINRASGLITLGSQTWAGPVNGGGQTLSNVVIAGLLTDPTTTLGDLIVRNAATPAALVRLAVGTNNQVLTVDTSLPARMKWAAAAGGVPTTRVLTAGTGLTGGGDLSADRTFAVVDDTSIQKHRISAAGTLIGTRREINFVNGANVTISVTDDTPNNRVNVSVASTGGGGGMVDPMTAKGDLITRNASAGTRLPVGLTNGHVLTVDSADVLGIKWAAAPGGSQSPWTADINAATWTLYNVGKIGIGLATAVLTVSPLHVKGTSVAASLVAEAQLVTIHGSSTVQLCIGSEVASPYGAWLQTKNQGNTGASYPLLLNPLGGNVGIAKTNPGHPLDITGNCNITGSYFKNGVMHTHAAADISTGVMAVARLGTGTADTTKFLRGDGTWNVLPVAADTPWDQSHNAAAFNLVNVGALGIGVLAPLCALDVAGHLALRAVTVTLANGSQTMAATTRSYVNITGPTGPFTIAGIQGGTDGKLLILWNLTASIMTITSQDASAAAADRIVTPGNASTPITSSAILLYNVAYAIWVLVAHF